jgi:hypothetical protein
MLSVCCLPKIMLSTCLGNIGCLRAPLCCSLPCLAPQMGLACQSCSTLHYQKALILPRWALMLLLSMKNQSSLIRQHVVDVK